MLTASVLSRTTPLRRMPWKIPAATLNLIGAPRVLVCKPCAKLLLRHRYFQLCAKSPFPKLRGMSCHRFEY
eukprot:322226-Amphidinium_carterae.1